MLYAIIVILAVALVFQTWRKRVYYRQYKLLLNAQVAIAVREMSKIWGEALAESALGRNEWPEQLDEHIH